MAIKTELVERIEKGPQQVTELHKVSPPIAYGWEEPEGEAEYVLFSAVSNAYANETFIFPADKDGNILNWHELHGSHNLGMDIPLAIKLFKEFN